MSFPLSLTVQSLANAMLAKPGLRSVFHLMIGITMGKIEAALQAATDYLLVLDQSGSMGEYLEGATKLDAMKNACDAVLNQMTPNDRLGVIAFGSNTQLIIDFTPCDAKGRVLISNAIWGIDLQGGTAYEPAVQEVRKRFKKDTGHKKVGIFLTDGDNLEGGDPLPACQKLKDEGVTLFAGGIGVSNEGEKLLEAMAGAKFRGLNDAADVSAFFAGAQAQAASAVITNAQLRIAPVNFATVQNFELVTRGGAPNYTPADASKKVVPIGDVGDARLESYLGLQVTLPEDIKPGRRAFGKIELVGDVPSQGIKAGVLAQTPIAVMFTDQPVPGVNEAVKNMINTAATARELYAAGQAKNTADMQQHLAAARKTVAFSNDAVAQSLAAQLKSIEAQVAKDPEAAQKQARRATKGFSAADAAAALKNLKKN